MRMVNRKKNHFEVGKTLNRPRISASLGLRIKFKTLFMSNDIRIECSHLYYSDCEHGNGWEKEKQSQVESFNSFETLYEVKT